MDLALEVILQYIKKNPQTLLIITSDHGNSGWGINGTGTSYNDATLALKKYGQNYGLPGKDRPPVKEQTH